METEIHSWRRFSESWSISSLSKHTRLLTVCSGIAYCCIRSQSCSCNCPTEAIKQVPSQHLGIQESYFLLSQGVSMQWGEKSCSFTRGSGIFSVKAIGSLPLPFGALGITKSVEVVICTFVPCHLLHISWISSLCMFLCLVYNAYGTELYWTHHLREFIPVLQDGLPE